MRAGVLAVVALAAVLTAPAYDLIYGPGGARVYWTSGQIPFVIRMAQTPTLQDGTNYASSMLAAMAAWNAQLANVQFAPTVAGPGLAGDLNGINEIAFDSKIYSNALDGGDDFGANVLAVTLSYRGGQRPDGSYARSQSDILFNTSWNWNSYRGALQFPEDIRRVAIHELGHVLGLDHPDQAGQTVTAIMNSTVSNTDSLQADDLVGAQFLYGRPGGFSTPSNDGFANATALTLSGTTASVTGSSVGASKESGEPNHAPDEPGGASIWWKWTATANGTLTATTAGSAFDTMLGVYTGSAVNTLTQLSANDDVDPGVVRTSTATVAVTSGTTYYFAVDGWDGMWGSVRLNLNFVSSGEPPTITFLSSSQTVSVGENATFSVSADGSSPLAYQWRKGGDNISGASAAQFSISNATLGDAGTYSVVVSNSAGSVTSSDVTLTVNLRVQSITFDALADRLFTPTPFSLAATASSGLPVSLTVLSGPATLSGNSLTLTGAGVVNIRATQAGNSTYAAASTVDRSFTVGTTLGLWQLTQFTADELGEPAISGPDADPDGDGLSNLLEYALGLSPRVSSAAPTEFTATDTEWSYTFTRPSDRADLTYAVEASADLLSWSTTGVTLTRLSTSNGLETWRATIARAPGSNSFLRLRVTR